MFEHEIEIDKPIADVYAAFRDPDNLPRWLTGLQKTVQISGTPGEVGSVSKQIYLERGRTVEMIETITAHEPGRYFAGTLEGPGRAVSTPVSRRHRHRPAAAPSPASGDGRRDGAPSPDGRVPVE